MSTLIDLDGISVSPRAILLLEKAEMARPLTKQELQENPNAYWGGTKREKFPSIKIVIGGKEGERTHGIHFPTEEARDTALIRLQKQINEPDPVIDVAGHYFRVSQVAAIRFFGGRPNFGIGIKLKGVKEIQFYTNQEKWNHYKQVLPKLLSAKQLEEVLD